MFGGLFALTGGSLQNDASKQQQKDGTERIIAFHGIPRFWVDVSLKNKCDHFFFTQLFMTIECFQSVYSIVHDNRMLAERAFYCLCRRRYNAARISEPNWTFASRFFRCKAPAEWNLKCGTRRQHLYAVSAWRRILYLEQSRMSDRLD